ncbi:Ogr/Delta-like zinc finger protein [Zymomonas mobilis]|uniref:Ogr/Delta-like zinc finger protein n=1 Tax=Zymomonas mobilis TaxID=542 RepID=A0A542VUC0_ZYMMB|nr:ogr/Delta-like zinc finger family protein [Zymomonas mobilis]TQL14923.1 Ogr/Delta-like zinc finger protein [Zymomonas mobilis]
MIKTITLSANKTDIPSGYCPYCGARVYVLSSHKQSESIRDSCVECNNKRCGHRFVLQISFIHTVEEPKFFDVSLNLPKSPKLKARQNDN